MRHAEILKQGQKAFFAEPPDYKKAEACFEKVTSLAPNWVEGYHCLASALEGLGEKARAVQAYKKAIECNCNDPRPRIALGRLLTSMAHLKEAIIELQLGLALKPHYCEADARLFLAEAFEKAKHLSKAIEQWKIVEKMEPFYPSQDKPMQEAQRKLRRYAKYQE